MDGERNSPPVTVLCFVGTGRSGTTILNSILGQVPGFFAAGELRYLWQRGVAQDHLCGCGEPFSECPVWTSVMKRVRSGHGAVDEPAIGRRLLERLRILHLPRMATRRLLGRGAVPFHVDDVSIARLYRAIAEETGCSVIVDSSKLPTYALLLSQLSGVDLFVVHLVRDPRATAFSWLRRKESRDRNDDNSLMQRQGRVKSSLLWLVWNLLTARLWPDDHPQVFRVRYEDLVGAPRDVVTRLVQAIGADPAALPFVDDHSVRLQPTHSVAGNPNRHDTGVVRLRADDEWKSAMSTGDAAVVTALTAPGLVRFGYPLRFRPSADSAHTDTTSS